ncbi:MAG: hypothetical protein ACREP9_21795, partial [Candidatus Dormibacteraceae bacterium]
MAGVKNYQITCPKLDGAEHISNNGGLLYYCLKLLALINTERLFRTNQDAFPQNLRIVLGENDSSTFFLHWRWDL